MSYAANKGWRVAHPEKWAAYKKKNYAARRFGNRRPWLLEELTLMATWEKTDTELAVLLSRSVQAIQVKRSKLKARER